MTWFNFLKKDVVVHCYTANAGVFNFAPIQKATAFIPDWWKALPKSVPEPQHGFPLATMKGCAGFTDLYKHGFIMPMWSDAFLKIGEIGTNNYFYKFSDGWSKMTQHNAHQRGDAFPETSYQHLKIESPWEFECDEEVNFMQTEVFWNRTRPESMLVMPGVQNFKHQHGTNVNTLWVRKEQEQEHFLSFGTPLAQFTPLTERNVRLELHLVSIEEMQKRHAIAYQSTFINKYRSNKRALAKQGCPYHSKMEK